MIGLTAIVIGITAIATLALDFVMNTQVPMQEVGATSEYSQLVGKTFRTREDLRVFGITADRHYAPHRSTTSCLWGGLDLMAEK